MSVRAASSLRLLLVALVATLFTSVAATQDQGRTYFWMRIWPDQLIKFDPVTDTVVQTVTNINGVSHGTELSYDKKRFLSTTGQRTAIEVVDVATGEHVEQHYFSEPGWLYRISDVKEVPGGTHWYVRLDRLKRELDHFVVEKDQWLYYDHTKWEIEKRMDELPEPIRRGAQVSPDGKTWHVFGRDFEILDAKTYESLGKIDLSKPLYSGMGRLSITGEDWFDLKNPTAYRRMYTMRDPVKTNRTLVGVLDLDLVSFSVTNLREWGASPGTNRLRYSHDKKIGIGTKWNDDRRDQANGDDPILTLLSVDLETGRALRETRIEVRNGLRLSAISRDAKKIYLTGRGHELSVYDDQHRFVKTIELEGETDGWIHVVEE